MRFVLFALLIVGCLCSCAYHGWDDACEESIWDRANCSSNSFNVAATKTVLFPLGVAWRTVIPSFLGTALRNFIDNLDGPRNLLNGALQGRFPVARDHLTVFLINTSLGIGGLIDMHRLLCREEPVWFLPESIRGPIRETLPREPSFEDFDQTLATWGIPAGPYWILPLVDPQISETSPRQLVGFAVDSLTYPWFWISFAISIDRMVTLGAGASVRIADGVEASVDAFEIPELFEDDFSEKWRQAAQSFLDNSGSIPYSEKQELHRLDRDVLAMSDPGSQRCVDESQEIRSVREALPRFPAKTELDE